MIYMVAHIMAMSISDIQIKLNEIINILAIFIYRKTISADRAGLMSSPRFLLGTAKIFIHCKRLTGLFRLKEMLQRSTHDKIH